MEIKISRSYSGGNYTEKEKLNLSNEVLALISHDDQRQSMIIFSENDMEQINKFLNIKGWAGHIPFHDWLKENKSKYFRENITDMDKEGIVLPLLIKLKEFLDITD